MGRVLLIVFGVVLTVYSCFDVIKTPTTQVRFLPKILWVIVVIALPFVGPLLWLFFHQGLPPFLRGNPQQPPRGPRGPDDDPDYLRGL